MARPCACWPPRCSISRMAWRWIVSGWGWERHPRPQGPPAARAGPGGQPGQAAPRKGRRPRRQTRRGRPPRRSTQAQGPAGRPGGQPEPQGRQPETDRGQRLWHARRQSGGQSDPQARRQQPGCQRPIGTQGEPEAAWPGRRHPAPGPRHPGPEGGGPHRPRPPGSPAHRRWPSGHRSGQPRRHASPVPRARPSSTAGCASPGSPIATGTRGSISPTSPATSSWMVIVYIWRG